MLEMASAMELPSINQARGFPGDPKMKVKYSCFVSLLIETSLYLPLNFSHVSSKSIQIENPQELQEEDTISSTVDINKDFPG